MDNRVVAIGIVVMMIAAYIEKIPQRVWGLIVSGKRATLGETLQSIQSTVGMQSAPSDAVASSRGGNTAGSSNGILPGTSPFNAGSGANAGAGGVAQLIALHQLALTHPGVDKQLDDLVSRLPVTNNPQQGSWVNAFRLCYGAGGSVSACAAQATQNVGVSPFG